MKGFSILDFGEDPQEKRFSLNIHDGKKNKTIRLNNPTEIYQLLQKWLESEDTHDTI